MENRNLQWNKRVKVPLILIFSVNTNHESVAYRSFSPSKFEARGARKVTTGINRWCYLGYVGLKVHDSLVTTRYRTSIYSPRSEHPGSGLVWLSL